MREILNRRENTTTATAAVLPALTKLYEDADADSMKGFAEAIAEAAVVAVQQVIGRVETEVSRERIR